MRRGSFLLQRVQHAAPHDGLRLSEDVCSGRMSKRPKPLVTSQAILLTFIFYLPNQGGFNPRPKFEGKLLGWLITVKCLAQCFSLPWRSFLSSLNQLALVDSGRQLVKARRVLCNFRPHRWY